MKGLPVVKIDKHNTYTHRRTPHDQREKTNRPKTSSLQFSNTVAVVAKRSIRTTEFMNRTDE